MSGGYPAAWIGCRATRHAASISVFRERHIETARSHLRGHGPGTAGPMPFPACRANPVHLMSRTEAGCEQPVAGITVAVPLVAADSRRNRAWACTNRRTAHG